MITRWKIEPRFDEHHQDRYLVSVRGDKEDIEKVVKAFPAICKTAFSLNDAQEEFNWGVYFFSPEKEDRLKVEKFVRKLAEGTIASSPEDNNEENNSSALAHELGGIIKEITTKGTEPKEVFSSGIHIPQIKNESPAVGTIKPLYLVKEEKVFEEPLVTTDNVVRLGVIYPQGSEQEIKGFLQSLADTLCMGPYQFFSLEKMYEKKMNGKEQVTVKDLVETYYSHKLEVLLVFIFDFAAFPEAKYLTDILKKMPKKRKIFIKPISMKKISLRTTFVDLLVDFALLKGRGIGDFHH